MKNFFVFLFIFLAHFFVFSLELKIGYVDEPLPPFAMGTGTTQPNPPGIYIDIINQVAKDLGISVIYKRQPVKRVQLSIEEGLFDAYFSLSYKPERLKLGQYPMKNGTIDGSRRIGAVSYFLYKLEDSPLEWDGKTIKNVDKEIGANLGFSVAEDLRKMGYQVSETKTTGSNLKKLQLGVISAFAGQDVDTDALIKTGKYGKIVKIQIPLSTKHYFIIFSNQFMKDNSAIAEKFWDRLGQIRDKKIEEMSPLYLEEQE
ncbi:MAG TPA: transporter substrate-binding domain-containing protein [Spirochaetota bacterium]|nr:transporter substrate-binding domain-containing protein [Spirochaetota bacterium]